MASGSFGVSTSNANVVGTCSWSSTPNTEGNYSDVYIELRLSRTNNYSPTWGTGSFQVGINGYGTIDSGSKSFTITYNSNTLMVSGTIRVYHDDNGSKQMGIWADGNSDVFDVYAASSSPFLDTIPRASSLTSGCDWTAGISNLPITINRASTDFHHTVEVRVQRPSDNAWVYIGSRDWIYTSGLFTFSQAETTAIYQALGGYENRPSMIRVITYNSGGGQIGYKDFYGTCYAATPATITFNDFYIGDSIPATINNMYSGFTYSGSFVFGSFQKTFNFDSATPNPTLTFTAAEIQSLYAKIPNANEGTGTITISSKYNGVEINDGIPVDVSKDFKALVRNSNPTFGTNFTYKDTLVATTALTANNQYIIQNKSTVLVEIPTTAKASAINGASMVSYEATLNGVTKTAAWSSTALVSFDFGVITAATNLTLTVTAIDSRGNRTTQTKTVTVVPYSPPIINATASRLNNFEAQTTIDLDGSISGISVGGVLKNDVLLVQYRYKDTATTTWGAWTNFAFTKSLPTFDATAVQLTLDNVKSFNIEIQVQDKLETQTASILINAGQPVLFPDFIKKGIGVNKFPEAGRAMDINGGLWASGALNGDSLNVNSILINTINKALELAKNGSSLLRSDASDFNSITSAGFYQINSSLNSPPKSISNPNDYWHVLVLVRKDDAEVYPWIVQIAIDFRDGIYIRRCWMNGTTKTWDAWRRITDERRLLANLWRGSANYAANTWYRIDFDAPSADNNQGGIFTDINNCIVLPEAGWYEITVQTYIVQSVGTSFYCQWWEADTTGGAKWNVISTYAPANGWNHYYGSVIVNLKANQKYELLLMHGDNGYTRQIGEIWCTVKRL